MVAAAGAAGVDRKRDGVLLVPGPLGGGRQILCPRRRSGGASGSVH